MKNNILIILLTLFLSSQSFSQVMADCTYVQEFKLGTFFSLVEYDKQTDKIELRGKVIDLSDSLGMPSANIICIGSKLGAVADINGEYILAFNLTQIDSLYVSFIGYKSVTFSVRDKIDELFSLHKNLQNR